MHSTPALSRLRHFQLLQFHGLSLITRYKRIQLRSEGSSTSPSTALSRAPAQTSEAQEQGRYAGSTWFVMKGETQWIKLWSWSITTKKVRCLSQTVMQAHNVGQGHFRSPDIFQKKSGKTQESQDRSSWTSKGELGRTAIALHPHLQRQNLVNADN